MSAEQASEPPRTIDNIVDEIARLDEQMIDIRFKSSQSNDQVIEMISQQLNHRNELTEELQRLRAKEFHSFIDSLDLKAIQITPFYPVPRRCKLQLTNPESTELVRTDDEQPSDPWKKMLSTFIQKKSQTSQEKTKTAIGILAEEQQRIILEKKEEIELAIHKLESKPMLSPTDIAHKMRLSSELEELSKFQKGKK